MTQVRDDQVQEKRQAMGPIVWLSGVGWDDVTHTDRRMVEAIAVSHDVVFVDSPHPGHWVGWLRGKPPAVEQVQPRVLRLRVPAPPLSTKPLVRSLTRLLFWWTLHRGLSGGTKPAAVVVASPITRFPRRLGGRRILYATDNWLAGAGLMGLSPGWVRRVMTANARQADAVAAVAPVLLQQLRSLGAEGVPAEVLPNGAPPPGVPSDGEDALAILVGNLNERLDLACLEAVVDAGVRLRVLGPRVDRQSAFGRRLKALLGRSGVEWVGRIVPPEQVALQLATARVGLTPYLINPFNQASFPLKTFDYLAAGLPVVSTNIDASRWLATEHIRIADGPKDFARLVVACIAEPPSRVDVQARQRLASEHGWSHRAAHMIRLAGVAPAE